MVQEVDKEFDNIFDKIDEVESYCDQLFFELKDRLDELEKRIEDLKKAKERCDAFMGRKETA